MSTATVTPPPASAPQPPGARMTADEFGLRYSGARVEYVNGEVEEIPMAGGMHGKVCYRAAMVIGGFVDSNALGHMFINDTFVRVPVKDDPQRVYGADVCFVSYARLARDAKVAPGVIPVCPELVIEVRSPSDTWAQVFRKVGDYLEAGVSVVVVLDPDTRTASAYRNDGTNPQQIFTAADTLTLPDVLPGFAVPVARLFE
jgi:Uma2 family endonuclease